MLVDIDAFVIARERVYDLEPGGFQLGQVGVGKESPDIPISGFEGCNLGGIIRHEAEEDLIQLGASQPVALVSHEAGEAARFPFLK